MPKVSTKATTGKYSCEKEGCSLTFDKVKQRTNHYRNHHKCYYNVNAAFQDLQENVNVQNSKDMRK